MGENFYNETLAECCEHFCINRKKDARKKPHVIERIINKAKASRKHCEVLEEIVRKIVNLKESES